MSPPIQIRTFAFTKSLIPTNRLLRQIDVHLFDVEVLLDAPFAEFASEAALLVAAPRRFDVGGLHVVDPDDAGAQRLDRTHRTEDIAGPDGRGEPEIRVVGDAQRVFLVVEWNHRRDRAEDFL